MCITIHTGPIDRIISDDHLGGTHAIHGQGDQILPNPSHPIQDECAVCDLHAQSVEVEPKIPNAGPTDIRICQLRPHLIDADHHTHRDHIDHQRWAAVDHSEKAISSTIVNNHLGRSITEPRFDHTRTIHQHMVLLGHRIAQISLLRGYGTIPVDYCNHTHILINNSSS